MMKVVHIITGLGDGGAEAALYRLVGSSEKASADHCVVSLSDEGKYASMLRAKGISVHCLDMPKGSLSIDGLFGLWRILRRERPNVVQTWMYHANLVGGVLARLAGIKNVVWGLHHTLLLPGTTGRSTRAVDRLCARLSPWVPRKIIGCAQESMRVHVVNGYDGAKFVVVPNGYDTSLFTPDGQARISVRNELEIPADVPVLGLVGRWDPLKDHANLLAATRHVRERHQRVQLLLVGSGCDASNKELVDVVAREGLTDCVHLLGRRGDVPAIMNALDVHVLSSMSEAFPNVVAEAMACGTPCVVTNVGDAADIVGSTGWSVPARNPAALADAISVALRESESQEEWAKRKALARQRIVERFSLGAMISGYNEVWVQ